MTIAPSDVSSVPVLPASAVTAIGAAQMAEVDRAAIKDFGVTILQMMEQAGSHLAEVVRLELGGSLDERRVVVVGPGNNGGGGLVAARHLADRGVIQARLTQQELAEMIGTTRETLAHTLGDLRRRGLLDMARHQVTIRDAERLADVAEGGAVDRGGNELSGGDRGAS